MSNLTKKHFDMLAEMLGRRMAKNLFATSSGEQYSRDERIRIGNYQGDNKFLWSAAEICWINEMVEEFTIAVIETVSGNPGFDKERFLAKAKEYYESECAYYRSLL